MAVIMTSGMLYYVADRRQTPVGAKLRPFYEILSRWNEAPEVHTDHKKVDDVDKSKVITVGEIRVDAMKFLLRAIVYALLYMPAFATMDGFIRACQEPPEIFASIPYLHRLFKEHVPFRSMYYYIWVGITLSMHIAIVPLVHLFLHAIQLNVLAWIPNLNYKLLIKLHHDLVHFVAQPPIFNKPWLTRNVHDLWSKRWHQIFRPGFHQVAYNPIRKLFGPRHRTLGRLFGILGVFACSGLMHDYIVLAMLGYSNWNKPGILGYQTLFFMLQAIATITSIASPRLPTWISRVLTLGWILYTAPLFVEPYVRLGLHHNAEVPGFPKFMDTRIGGICPYGPRELISQ
ncbi:membrane bound O-acyl transferase family-domain-containing protein [Mycotypha africana]|uniref:membrane bound O-acyl transferase family-domain-containing protein n=1 Tax=Mycotypha africana TaxID=64632 RepID=UPI0023018529|nr:membrane bound O-acyl transferase family-domain-containing protein [Mycotypha africana]KAI8984631.1 membrane bound O-acyl transferase family-domain-containing protein [Mycotypha africana]